MARENLTASGFTILFLCYVDCEAAPSSVAVVPARLCTSRTAGYTFSAISLQAFQALTTVSIGVAVTLALSARVAVTVIIMRRRGHLLFLVAEVIAARVATPSCIAPWNFLLTISLKALQTRIA